MRMGELCEVIRRSKPEQWHQIATGGGEPTYRDKFLTFQSVRGSAGHVEVQSHHSLAVYRDDLDITLAWGLDAHDGDETHFDFTEKFPDPRSHVMLADIFYRGAIVHREYLITADGGRVHLPIGAVRSVDGSTETKEKYETIVTKWELDFARLLDSFTNTKFDSYFERSGMRIVDDPKTVVRE